MSEKLDDGLQACRLDRTEDLLRDLGRRLIEAHESERRRLSGELHDNLGQQLALLSAELVMLRETLGSSPLVVDRLDKLLAHTVELGTEVQRLSHASQEALHNVVRHSAAAGASVRREAHGGEIVLTVVDDGRGFDPLVEGAMNGRSSRAISTNRDLINLS